MRALVTGGAGYIGSHTIISLIENGHAVVAVDNLSNSSRESLRRVTKITGYDVPFVELDVADRTALESVFDTYTIDAVIHFAGLKAVGESVKQPLTYYRNNIDSTLALCDVMQKKHVKSLIFSSTATVYDTLQPSPLGESATVGIGITNPYSRSKYMIEEILKDIVVADPNWQITILRYFNPIGAHESGMIGEDPRGVPNNLLPYVSQVAVGKLDKLKIFGNDYPTPDGTGVRDYLHVVDLAQGHVTALENLKQGITTYNLGAGKGVSVLEVIKAFEKASGRPIPYEVVGRREGDTPSYYADSSLATRALGWKATKSLEQACEDTWRWQSKNPNGYDE